MLRHLGNLAFRNFLFQVSFITILALFIYYLLQNAFTNLEKQGVATGFDFLSQIAGFDIIMHLIDYSETSTYFRAFLVALLNTLLVSIIGIIFSTLLGFIIGIARLSSNWLVKNISYLYIEIFRNIPLLLQIFFWYFAILRALPTPKNSLQLFNNIYINIRGMYLPKISLQENNTIFFIIMIISIVLISILYRKLSKYKYSLGFIITAMSILVLYIFSNIISVQSPELRGFNFQGGIVIIPELVAMILALSIYTASFIAEIVRAGILSVNQGQQEAAQALGLPSTRILRLIIIPQALRVVIPPLTSQYLNLIKNSSLAAAIAYPELVSVFAGTVLNQTGQAIEVIMITMSIYLTISLTISWLMNYYNRLISFKEQPPI